MWPMHDDLEDKQAKRRKYQDSGQGFPFEDGKMGHE